MAKISRGDVLKLAKLANLELKSDEIDRLVSEIQTIIGYFEILKSADVEGLPPTYQVTGLKNVMRPDKVEASVNPSELLKNVPALEKGHIKVRRVLA